MLMWLWFHLVAAVVVVVAAVAAWIASDRDAILFYAENYVTWQRQMSQNV